MNYKVNIRETRTNEIIESMGPHSQRTCERIKSGVEINLNHRVYHVTIDKEEKSESNN